MRFALISCVHANLAAMEAVLRDARQSRCETMLCLGDVVGYFDHPKECLDLVRTHCQASVKGNHDEYCSASYPLSDFNPKAAKAVEWTRGELSPADQNWLSELPYALDFHDFTIVHASLNAPEKWSTFLTSWPPHATSAGSPHHSAFTGTRMYRSHSSSREAT
jgi:predicted phosphodiesterase